YRVERSYVPAAAAGSRLLRNDVSRESSSQPTHPCDEMQGRKPTGCRRSVARSGVCAGRCRGPCRRRSRGRPATGEVDPAASRIAPTEALVSPLQFLADCKRQQYLTGLMPALRNEPEPVP